MTIHWQEALILLALLVVAAWLAAPLFNKTLGSTVGITIP